MVDAIISFAIERLGDYLIKEASFLKGVKDEVKSLKKDLEWMHSFIKDAEHKQGKDHLIHQWISDIKEIAYDTEDVLDEFMLKVHDEETSKMFNVNETGTSKGRQGLFTFMKKCFCICDQESNLYSIGKEIKALKNRLSDVSRRRVLFGLENSNNMRDEESQPLGKLRQLRRTTSFERAEINVVGFEDDTRNLLNKLLDNEPRRFIISIFGTGGLGKTTLARKLYHDQDVSNKFGSYRAWVSVSQEYGIQDLLLRIIKSFNIGDTKELEGRSVEDLERYLHQSLQRCSYLMVMDDVWDKQAWKCLERAFPDNKNGSRVIITTRNKDIAEHSDKNTYAHALRFLSPDESWKLFCEKAFENSIADDETLENLGREMVKKCGGLPLAIVVLGGLLYKRNLKMWHHVHKQIWQDLSKDFEISSLLELSFNVLPHPLKACFLYLGHFPEDYEIDTEELIRLWVAEGFTPQTEKEIEDEANDCLNELINSSLIQINSMRGGRIETCRLHDLLRDLAIRKAKELNFLEIYEEIRPSSHSSTSCRRLAIYFRESHPRSLSNVLHACVPFYSLTIIVIS